MILAEITFSLNVGQFISLPILLALLSAVVWLRIRLKPLEASIGSIAATVASSVDTRFKELSDKAVADHKELTDKATADKSLQQEQYNTLLTAVTDLIKETASMAEHMKTANSNAKEHSDEDIKRFGDIQIHLSNIEGRLGLPPGGVKG